MMIIFDIGWNLILWYKLIIFKKKIVVGLSDLLVVIILIIG